MVGLGDAVTFISVLRLVPHWFPPRRVPLLTQLTGICGQLGQVLSALPFLALLTGTTWATAYISVAALGVLALVLVAALVKDAPHGRVVATETMTVRAMLASVKTVWLRPGTRLGFFTHMGTQFSVTVFALMWGVPYLTVAQGQSAGTAGALLTVSVVAAIGAGIVIGILTARHPNRRSRVVLAIIASNALVWTVVLALPGPRTAVAADGPRRGHLDRRPGVDGRIRLRADVQPQLDPRHRPGHGQHGRIRRLAVGHAGDGPDPRRDGRVFVRVVPTWPGRCSTPSGSWPSSAS